MQEECKKKFVTLYNSEINEIWDKLKITTKEEQYLIAKMQKKYEQCRAPKKTKSKHYQIQIAKETSF